jgi:hypothetical protein
MNWLDWLIKLMTGGDDPSGPWPVDKNHDADERRGGQA